ncbi:type VI secretion system membrane subunit TssM [Azospirillum sp. TSH64]|uniref:type VI secretion system membrane subunit TssM n=1 Tax=Azospirillum sp. TSH64 TaxID=652740 RepID=UPI000D69ABD4|nr:type VI secretion system membrane subunit TssM [Azospirillum sp. TSH64]
MTSMINILTARWFTTLVGALVLCLLVWFVGPLVAIGDARPLEADLVRFAVVLVVLVAWGVANMLALSRAKKTEAELVEAVTGGADAGGGGGGDAAAAEVATLKERLDETVALLRKSNAKGGRGRRFLYEMPWYMMIGPPGSGKSTALENCGLVRHAAGRSGRSAVRGVGGTRNCEWLFTEEAVLIDTAGRYTTQDSNESVDAAGWRGFLDMLKKTRPRQPISGAIVAISLADLAGGSESERASHAQAVRQRLNELYGTFGVRFPTYLLLTKADLIAGFTEFFDDLDKGQREQVWGATLPYTPDPDVTAEGGFAQEFDLLQERLNTRLHDRLQQESDPARRSLIFGFPAQVASLREPVMQFLADVFEGSRYEHKPLLRGVYFTSGTQEGTPIDRLTANIARMVGAGQAAVSPFTGGGRAYFLTNLLRGVIFPEANLVSTNPQLERRLLWMQRGVLAATAVTVLAALGVWTGSTVENRSLIAEAEAAADRFVEQIESVPKNAGQSLRLEAVLPPLDTMRALALKDGQPAPVGATFGLYQGDKIYAQAAGTYSRALNALLLPPLVYRLEAQIRQNQQNTEFLYEALKVYLMLGGQGPLDAALVRQWMALDWTGLYPDPTGGPMRETLLGHLNALLSAPLTPVPLDQPLVEQARRQLARFPLAERAYAQLRQVPAARKLPEWRVVDIGGPAAGRVFARRSGKLLSEGIPGLYTRDGFYTVLLPSLTTIAEDVARESWVLGDPGRGDQNRGDQGRETGAGQVGQLSRDVLQLYLNDYIARWDGVLADLTLVPMQTASVAAQVASELSGPASPLRNVLLAANAQTKLAAGKSATADAAATVTNVATAAKLPGGDRLASVMATTTAAANALPEPGKAVDDHFAPLHSFVEGRTGVAGASLDDLMRLLNDLYLQLNRAQGGGPTGVPGAPLGPSPAQQIAAVASRMPGPVAALAQQMGRAGSSATVGTTRTELNAQWTAQILPFCRQATENRYPVYRSGAADVMLADFAKLFGPNGLIDSFFNQQLRPYVDMTRQPWQWQKVDGADLGIASGVLAQFQRAIAIRDTFFSGGAGPMVRFDLVPTMFDSGVTQAVIEVDGQPVKLVAGQTRPLPVQWPGPSPQTRVTVNDGQAPDMTVDGPWSWFRLLDRAKVAGSGMRDRITVTLAAGGGNIGFELRAGSVLNPFAMKELSEFRCPGAL